MRKRASWSNEAPCWCTSTRGTRGTRSRRPRPTWTWRAPSSPTPPARSAGRTSCSRPRRSRRRRTRRHCSIMPTPSRRWCAPRCRWTMPRSSSRTPTFARPITGTVIEKDIERGTVIASATSNVSGGTTLLKMANLDLVQVRTLVDETDVGKIEPGQLATITVDAFPNRHLRGHGAQDRAAGEDRAERDRLPGAGPHPQRGRAAPAGDEHRGRDPRRPAGQRAGGAQRGAPHAA